MGIRNENCVYMNRKFSFVIIAPQFESHYSKFHTPISEKKIRIEEDAPVESGRQQ